MGEIEKRRIFLKDLLRNEVSSDIRLERLKPKTDELGNYVMPPKRKNRVSTKITLTQSEKQNALMQDLARQTQISNTTVEKRKEMDNGLTVIPIEQTRSTVQKIGDTIDMQDTARKNARRLVNDPDEEQNIMSVLISRDWQM